MSEKERYEYWKDSDTAYDTKITYGQYFRIIDKREMVYLLNKYEKQLNELNKYCTACDDTLTTIQELTYKLLSVDFAGAESKVDYCRLLNELDNKDLSFIHDCIKAINECDIMKMDELKREYGDCE